MPRRTYTFKPKVAASLNKEAIRRIEEGGLAGMNIGSIERDLLTACFLLAFQEVKVLSKSELTKLIKKAK